jgi:integrase
MGHAVWVGILPANPVNQVPRSMRPKTDAKKMRVLSFEEIDVLLKAAPKRYRTLLATAIFTGLRFGELLALRWEDIDFGRGFIRVGDSKTESGAHREVVMMPSLASRLLEHRLESGPEGLVFASETGSKLDQHNVRRRGLEKAVGGAKIEAVRFQELRHTFASIMIGQGHDVVFVSRQLGHANAAITLRIYAHLFDQQSKADEARAALEERFGSLL